MRVNRVVVTTRGMPNPKDWQGIQEGPGHQVQIPARCMRIIQITLPF